jgi:hypothetical protein
MTDRARYLAYQAAAQALAAGNLRIADRPVVQMTEDGAFVEASIWIPASALHEPPIIIDK